MANNHEVYFGSPEKAAHMRVRCVDEDIIGPRLIVVEVVPSLSGYPYQTWVFYSTEEYLEWLQEECDG